MYDWKQYIPIVYNYVLKKHAGQRRPTDTNKK